MNHPLLADFGALDLDGFGPAALLRLADGGTDVTVYGDRSGFVTLGVGLAGRTEMSIELADAAGSSGLGRRLIRDAIGGVPQGEYLLAAVAPGNARSLRSFLAAGFVPIGGEVIVGRPAVLD